MSTSYEQFRHELMLKFIENGIDKIEDILKLIDMVSPRYNIELIEKLPAVYDGGIPYELKEYLVEKTLQGYSKALLKNQLYFFTILFRNVSRDIKTIRPNDIRGFLYSYQAERKVTNRTLDKYRCWVSALFKWFLENGYIENDPTLVIKPIKYEHKKRDAMTSTQWEIFRNLPTNPKEKIALEFLFSTGCRIEEMCSVKIGDIDMDNKELRIFGKGNKERTVYLNDKTYLLLKDYIKDKESDDYLISASYNRKRKMSTNGIRRWFENWNKQVPDFPFKVTPHIIRHTMATTMVDRGVPIEQISAILGHSQLETTMVYINLNASTIKDNHRKYIV